MNKKVVYTSVFGCSEENNYHLHDPELLYIGMKLKRLDKKVNASNATRKTIDHLNQNSKPFVIGLLSALHYQIRAKMSQERHR